MPSGKTDIKITPEDYLKGGEVSDIRHEYLDGEVYAMSGGTLNHNRIAINLLSFLDNALDGSGCRPYINDVKVRVQTLERDFYYYPDVVVTCSDKHNKNEDKKTLSNIRQQSLKSYQIQLLALTIRRNFFPIVV